MKKLFLLLVLNFISCVIVFAQGTIRGKVSDENGETLIGVTIVLKSNRSVGVVTDLDGNYSLKIPDSTTQTLIISYVSYTTREENVTLLNNEIVVKDFTLASSAKVLKGVEISVKVEKDKGYYMETLKKKSANTIDYIDAGTMKRTGDNNVTAAVARVSGVSTNGGFITVRGIGDRYVKTTINGSRIPTLDPFTNNIKLDLFPASLVDNIVITKTASPDLPGDWAGAYLSVETKDYPDKLAVNIETTVGYNDQSTLKNVVSSQRSSTDWLGYDNNLRDHNQNNFTAVNMNPTTYQQMVALGLGDYYKSIGVTGWSEGTSTGDTYYKLGLVQLGLLDKALFNDPAAFEIAKEKYDAGQYKNQAFTTINAKAAESGKSFANNWNTTTRKAPLNFSQSFSIGDQTTLLGKPLGFIAGFRYGSSTQYDPNSTSSRIDYLGNIESKQSQQTSKETNGWSALVNLAYKLSPNHSISFLFMPNYTGVNNARNALNDLDKNQLVVTKSQYYEQRKQMVYQFKSEHYLPGPKMKIELNASYTDGKSSAPDFKNLQYWKTPTATPGEYVYLIGGQVGEGVHRYYRYLSDNIFDSRISAELPIMSDKNKPDLVRKLKFGGAYQTNNKKSDQYDYQVAVPGPDYKPLVNDNIDQFFDLNNFGIHNYTDVNGVNQNTIDLFYNGLGNDIANHTFGTSKIGAGFAMLDYSINNRIRVSGGLRMEQANILTDVYQYNALGYASDDERRNGIKPGKLNELSYLPSANVIYKIKKDEITPVNLRLNYSETVARPSIRELSGVQAFDYELRSPVLGNPDLKIVRVKNYDLRLESYFKNGDNVSISGFYKNFKNHIELVNSGVYTWQNADKSYVEGVEIEGKKTLTKHLDFRANITVVNSSSTVVRYTYSGQVFTPVDTIKRSMFGQAPYIINAILTYNSDSLGLTATISYNVQGPRLVIASNQKAIPDVYELERHLLDFKVSKKLGKHFTASFTIRDILNAPIRRSYKGSETYYDEYKYGTNYVLGISYKL